MKLKMRFEGMKPFTADAKHIPGELEDGAELITFHLNAAQERAQFYVEAALATFVAIEPTDKGWLDLMRFLGMIGPYVEHVVEQLGLFVDDPTRVGLGPADRFELTPWTPTPN